MNVLKGWWCVRFGDALAWVEAPSEAAAVWRSLDPHPLGDWTHDARELVVFPQDSYPEPAGPHDYTRAVPGPSGFFRELSRRVQAGDADLRASIHGIVALHLAPQTGRDPA